MQRAHIKKEGALFVARLPSGEVGAGTSIGAAMLELEREWDSRYAKRDAHLEVAAQARMMAMRSRLAAVLNRKQLEKQKIRQQYNELRRVLRRWDDEIDTPRRER